MDEPAAQPLVAIIGGRSQNVADPGVLPLAEEVGRELAVRGYGVISGGDDGVAAAVNRGCRRGGGTTIALFKGTTAGGRHPDVQWSIPTSFDLARSVPLVWAGVGIIAFEGRYGTLFELALALDAERPIVVVGPQPLLNVEAVRSAHCRFLSDMAATTPSHIVDTLEALVFGDGAPRAAGARP